MDISLLVMTFIRNFTELKLHKIKSLIKDI